MFDFADPCHPGPFIRDEILKPRGLNVTRGAAALGVTRPALSALLNERAELSPEMAIRLEKAFGFSIETMLKMQMAFNIAATRRMAKSINVKKWTPTKVKRRTGVRRSPVSQTEKA